MSELLNYLFLKWLKALGITGLTISFYSCCHMNRLILQDFHCSMSYFLYIYACCNLKQPKAFRCSCCNILELKFISLQQMKCSFMYWVETEVQVRLQFMVWNMLLLWFPELSVRKQIILGLSASSPCSGTLTYTCPHTHTYQNKLSE